MDDAAGGATSGVCTEHPDNGRPQRAYPERVAEWILASTVGSWLLPALAGVSLSAASAVVGGKGAVAVALTVVAALILVPTMVTALFVEWRHRLQNGPRHRAATLAASFALLAVVLAAKLLGVAVISGYLWLFDGVGAKAWVWLTMGAGVGILANSLFFVFASKAAGRNLLADARDRWVFRGWQVFAGTAGSFAGLCLSRF